jgi:hypothetical protein
MSHFIALALLVAGFGFADPAGDVSGAPDVTRVTVTPGARTVAFAITAADAGSWQDAAALLSVDTTGDGRTDFDYTLHSEHQRVTRDTKHGVLPTKAKAAVAGATLRYVVPLAELGKRRTIGFAVTTLANGSDRAPDAGLVHVRVR